MQQTRSRRQVGHARTNCLPIVGPSGDVNHLRAGPLFWSGDQRAKATACPAACDNSIQLKRLTEGMRQAGSRVGFWIRTCVPQVGERDYWFSVLQRAQATTSEPHRAACSFWRSHSVAAATAAAAAGAAVAGAAALLASPLHVVFLLLAKLWFFFGQLNSLAACLIRINSQSPKPLFPTMKAGDTSYRFLSSSSSCYIEQINLSTHIS